MSTNTEPSNAPEPKPTNPVWVFLIMGGIIALIFIGDYLKSRP